MTLEQAPNRQTPNEGAPEYRPVWPFLVATLLLWLALAPLPYVYYGFLRLTVLVVAWYGMASGRNDFSWLRVAFFGALAFPWAYLGMPRESWQPIDAVAGVCFALVAAAYRTADFLERRRNRSTKASQLDVL